MGERVTQPKRVDLARAGQLKKALENGAPPAFVQPAISSAPANGSCSANSCPIPAPSEPLIPAPSAATRLEFFEQMFQASADALAIADQEHRVLWPNETFVRLFGYSVNEVIGQQLENLVVPPDRLAE
jgi:PAS domain-containing protein